MISETQAKKFCKDDISLIENYHLAVNDKINKWVLHHRRGTIYSREGLKEIGEYYKRPAIELIFMLAEEHKRLHRTGNHLEEKSKKKVSEAMSKPVLQYSKDGELIREWFGAREAARVIGINQSSITRCCQGKRKSAGGFVWKYSESK